MQLAVAGYVCPQLKIADGHGHGSALVVEHGAGVGADCLGVDREQENLCHAHATGGVKSVDNTNGLSVPPLAAAEIMLIARNFQLEHIYTAPNVVEPRMTRVTTPPLSIQNCCFRI